MDEYIKLGREAAFCKAESYTDTEFNEESQWGKGNREGERGRLREQIPVIRDSHSLSYRGLSRIRASWGLAKP